jgi:hypothetical protein
MTRKIGEFAFQTSLHGRSNGLRAHRETSMQLRCQKGILSYIMIHVKNRIIQSANAIHKVVDLRFLKHNKNLHNSSGQHYNNLFNLQYEKTCPVNKRLGKLFRKREKKFIF